MKKRILILLFMMLPFSLLANTPLENIVVFGDSLSDSGNLYEYMKHEVPLSPPYFEGRFSDNKLWTENLVESLFPQDSTEHLLNYAFGGAGISDEDGFFTLKGEIDSYLLTHSAQAKGNTLFVVWIGANNYLGIPEDVEQASGEVVSGISRQLNRLAEAGAKHILVLNLPNLGKTPFANLYQFNTQLERLSLRHNEKIQEMVNHLSAQYPDTQWLLLDIQQFFSHILQEPQQYGFTNVVDACMNLDDNKQIQPQSSAMLQVTTHARYPLDRLIDCEGYFFFDPVHPTGKVHKIIAEKAEDYLQKVGIVERSLSPLTFGRRK